MQYINNSADLLSVCNKLKQHEVLALDTEFMRENTFVPVLCLLQIAAGDEVFVVDPVKLDLEPLYEILKDPKILKVFHSAYQDCDVFYKNFGLIIEPIFDTQIAASYLGYGDTISYEKLAHMIVGQNFNKNTKLTNWLNRPLTQAQIDYAVADVEHLLEIYEYLHEELIAHGRVAWHDQEAGKLYNSKNYSLEPCNAWKRITTKSKKKYFLNYLQAFAAYRENLAVKLNKPRRFIIKDDILTYLAKHQPKEASEVLSDRFLRKALSERQIAEIVKISVETHKNLKEDIQSEVLHRLNAHQKMLLDLLKILLQKVSTKEKIAARMIATTDDLIQFIGMGENLKIQAGWRNEIFGRFAKQLINGKITLAVKNKRIEILTI
jgi:ribonuclease D